MSRRRFILENTLARKKTSDRHRLDLTVCIVIILATFVTLYVRKETQRTPNYDEYLYAAQTREYFRGITSGIHQFVHAWRLYGHDSPLLPALSLPIAAFSNNPDRLILVGLPLLLCLFFVMADLALRIGFSRRESQWAALATVVLPCTLGYAVMFHFALLTTVLTAGCLSSYLASDRFRSTKVSMVFGLLLALLSLSRTVSLVYLAALAVPIMADQFFLRENIKKRLLNIFLTFIVAITVAGPWWLVCGRDTINYLTDAGYAQSSGFIKKSSALDIIYNRMYITLGDIGLILGIFMLLVFAGLKRKMLQGKYRELAITTGVVLTGMLCLASSSNAGTAFALPLISLFALISMNVLRQMQVVKRIGVGLLIFTFIFLMFGVGSPMLNGIPLWVSSLPSEEAHRAALGGSYKASPEMLSLDVLALINNTQTLVLRDDDILNINTLQYFAQKPGATNLVTPSYARNYLDPQDLVGSQFVVSGRSPVTLHDTINLESTDAVLRRAGFHIIFARTLSPVNRLDLWYRGE